MIRVGYSRQILKFYAADMCVKLAEKHRNERANMSFEACESRSLMHSVPLPSAGIAGAFELEMSYLIDLLLFR